MNGELIRLVNVYFGKEMDDQNVFHERIVRMTLLLGQLPIEAELVVEARILHGQQLCEHKRNRDCINWISYQFQSRIRYLLE